MTTSPTTATPKAASTVPSKTPVGPAPRTFGDVFKDLPTDLRSVDAGSSSDSVEVRARGALKHGISAIENLRSMAEAEARASAVVGPSSQAWAQQRIAALSKGAPMAGRMNDAAKALGVIDYDKNNLLWQTLSYYAMEMAKAGDKQSESVMFDHATVAATQPVVLFALAQRMGRDPRALVEMGLMSKEQLAQLTGGK